MKTIFETGDVVWINEFYYNNKRGGTESSKNEFTPYDSEEWHGEAVIEIIKHWDDEETGRRFIGVPRFMDSGISKFLDRNSGEQKVYFSEYIDIRKYLSKQEIEKTQQLIG